MKNFIVLVLMLVAFASQAQEITFKEVTTAEIIEKSVDLVVGDTTYSVTVTKTGSYKMPRLSQQGTEYMMYLGYPTSHKYNGNVVFTNKEQSEYFYYIVGTTGYPSKRKLER